VVILDRDVLEVDPVQLVPVLQQFLEFHVLVPEVLHLLSVLLRLLSVALEFFLHALHVLDVDLVLLLDAHKLLPVGFAHIGLCLEGTLEMLSIQTVHLGFLNNAVLLSRFLRQPADLSSQQDDQLLLLVQFAQLLLYLPFECFELV